MRQIGQDRYGKSRSRLVIPQRIRSSESAAAEDGECRRMGTVAAQCIDHAAEAEYGKCKS